MQKDTEDSASNFEVFRCPVCGDETRVVSENFQSPYFYIEDTCRHCAKHAMADITKWGIR